MSNVSTFGAFTMAKLGIYASQKAMQVTGNNITNINTPGYTRQQLELNSLYVGGSDRYASKWDAKMGSGVLVTGVNQIRSPYLDIRYRTSNSTLGALQSKMEGLNGLSAIFDEVAKGEDDEGVMEAALQYLIQQTEIYATNGAGQDTYDSILKGASKQIVNLFNSYAEKLDTLYKGQVNSLHEDVTEVNTILSEIQKLNNSIRKAEIHGSSALELKDERNVLIDKLSSFIRINVLYEEEDVGAGMKVDKLVIKLDSNDPHSENDGVCLVDGRYVTQLEVPALNIPDEGNTTIPVETVDHWDQFNVTLDELRDVHGNPRMKVEGMPITFAYGFAEGQSIKAGTAVTVGDVSFNLESEDKEGQLREIANKYYEMHKDDENGWSVSLNTTLDGLIFISKQPGAMVEEPVLDDNGDPVLDEKDNPVYNLKLPVGMKPLPEITVGGQQTTLESRIVNKGLEPVPYPQGRIDLTDNDLYGALQASREMLTEKGSFATKDDVARDPDAVTKCGIPYYIRMWDAMAVKFAKTMNDANTLEVKDPDGKVTDLLRQPNGDFVVQPHNYYLSRTTAKPDETQEFLDAEGNVIVSRKSNGKYYNPDGTVIGREEDAYNLLFEKGVVRDQFKGGVLFSNSGDTNDPTGITAKNISIAFDWDKGAVHVMQSRTDSPFEQSSQNSNLVHMLAILKDNDHPYSLADDTSLVKADGTDNFKDENGDPIRQGALVSQIENDKYHVVYDSDVEYFKGDYGEFLTKVASTLANDSSITNSRLYESNADVNELTVDRDSVSGVDLNDEAIAMMQYNKSYAAACRFLTQLDEMIDKLVNGTAI